MNPILPFPHNDEMTQASSADRLSNRIVIVFWVFLGLLLLARAGRLLEPLFPLSALAIAYYLCYRSPATYVSFVWWIWFLAPVVRRIIDYQVGGYTFGPWTLAPLLVTAVSMLSFFATLPKSYRGIAFPIVISASAMIYCAAISFYLPIRTTTFGILTALSVITFGYYLVIHWREHRQIQAATQKAFLWGAIVMGGYGIVQFLVAPPWDTFYMTSEFGNSAFGLPEPLKIRVFSTMTSPYSVATTLIAGIMISIGSKNPLRWLAMSLGSLTILLTLTRGCWLGFLVAIMLAVVVSKFRYKVRLISAITVVGFIIFGIASSESFQDAIFNRIDSLSTGDADASFSARKLAFDVAFRIAAREIVGQGFVGNAIIGDTGVPMGDNGILFILSSLGWVGCVPYFMGIIFAFLLILKTYAKNADPWLIVCFSSAIAVLAQIGAVDITAEVHGLVLWSFLGSGIASSAYNRDVSSHFNST
jgi:O-antigen ligase